jgi:quercetin dioxygenase-like cupin family protein
MQRSRLVSALITAGLAITLTTLPASATPPSGVSINGQPLPPGRVSDDIRIHTRLPDGTRIHLRSHDPTVVNVDNLAIAPGGFTGWHSHPTLAITLVTSGELTVHEWDGRTCSTRVLTTGTAMVEGPVTHDLRNHTAAPATFTVTQLVPEGLARRIDEPQPPGCP